MYIYIRTYIPEAAQEKLQQTPIGVLCHVHIVISFLTRIAIMFLTNNRTADTWYVPKEQLLYSQRADGCPI